MAQTVDRLKELLFDSEARALSSLAERIEGIEHLTLDEKRHREAIGLQIDEVFNRAGTTDRFEVSVAEVLDGALRRLLGSDRTTLDRVHADGRRRHDDFRHDAEFAERHPLTSLGGDDVRIESHSGAANGRPPTANTRSK